MLDYIKKIMEVQAKQGAQLSVIANKGTDMRNINAIKHLLKGDPEKHFEEIISRSMCSEVNVGGIHGKIYLNKYTSLYDVIICGLSAMSEKPDRQLSKCLHIGKKRLYRLSTVNKLKNLNN